MTAKTNLENKNPVVSFGKIILNRFLSMASSLIVIAYMTIFVLILAERGRAHLPAMPLQSAGNAVSRLLTYFFDHPLTYTWHRQDVNAFQFVWDTFVNSAGLLLVSIVFAAVVGVLFGMAAALSKGRVGSALVMTFSVLGMSTPSFLFAMLLWIFNIQVIQYKLGLKALPPTGLGWDLHLIMPALVLAARPLAQIAQVTYISLRDVLGEDYIRTARSKGLSNLLIYFRHAFLNIQIPVLTTVGTSIRYSIASLPVVEFFFVWPGIGLILLQAIQLGNTNLVMDLILALGLFFILFNLVLDVLYPVLDARLRKDSGMNEMNEALRWQDVWNGLWAVIKNLVQDGLVFLRLKARDTNQLPPLSSGVSTKEGEAPAIGGAGWKQWLQWGLGNPAFLIGSVLVIGLAALTLFGQHWTAANPYEMNGVMMLDGVIGAPPYEPSNTFPWGTDHLGRDMLALVLSGGQRTLTLALMVMAARLVLGTFLGVMAGWWQGGLFDRLITRLLSIWAAFPITLFAMLLIQAIGIQQGAWVFVVALCVVGWGEVTQFVRAQTLRIKPQLYVEASRSLGAGTGGILIRQVFPNLVASLIVIAALEMGGILMLLAELGFLNVFLGGGFRVEFAVGQWIAFSDVPEWGALLANIRDWWRSYPWMAWYPGAAFFLAIMTFNLFAEGLRQFLEDSRVNLSRWFNRYTFLSIVVLTLVITWVVQSQSPLGRYRSVARQFDSQRVLEDIEGILNPIFNGRESGTADDRAMADYLASQMKTIGLFPAAADGVYVHEVPTSRLHVLEQPALLIHGPQSETPRELVYRQDFVDYGGPQETYGEDAGFVMGLAYGPGDERALLQTLSDLSLLDKTLVIRAEDYGKPGLNNAAVVLVVAEDEQVFKQKKLYFTPFYRGNPTPTFWITEKIANELLAASGSSVSDLNKEAKKLAAGEIYTTQAGVMVTGSIVVEERSDDKYHIVAGVLPGEGSSMGRNGHALDNEVIVLSAYYDGLGSQPDGILYPGANDNASGVALMLEAARQLLDSPYAPSRTVVFIAWSGAERGEPFAVNDSMGSIKGLSGFVMNEVIEISGVGAGSGKGVSLGGESSYRLVKLAQQAGDRLNIPTTTRGRGPHYDIVPDAPVRIHRDVPTLYFSWDGADETAHTLDDSFEGLDPEKLTKSGQMITLILLVLSREFNY